MLRGWIIGLCLVALGGGCASDGGNRELVAADLAPFAQYIAGRDGKPGAGLAKTFRALSAMGYDGVVFDGYYGNDARTLKSMLADNGLVVCASRVRAADCAPAKISETCEFNLNFGNGVLLGGDAAAVGDAARCGCALVPDPTPQTLTSRRREWRIVSIGEGTTNELAAAAESLRSLDAQ